MFQVTFTFEDRDPVVVTAAPDSNLLQVARDANVAIDAPCSGNGSCGKCKVKLVSGELFSPQTGHISDEEYADGWRLSCGSKILSDVTVLVPDIASAYQSRMKTADLSSGEEIAVFEKVEADIREAGIDFTNDFVELELTLEEPTLDDTMPDNERLIWAVKANFEADLEQVILPYFVMRKLAKVLRASNFSVKVIGEHLGDVLKVYDVRPAADETPMVGMAVDIGTTTVAAVLVDLKTGKLLAKPPPATVRSVTAPMSSTALWSSPRMAVSSVCRMPSSRIPCVLCWQVFVPAPRSRPLKFSGSASLPTPP